jgi:diguanylate cyclase (GGDEF)-like protein
MVSIGQARGLMEIPRLAMWGSVVADGTAGHSPGESTNGATNAKGARAASASRARDNEQTLSDRDQTVADSDQTASDGDQTAADGDQAAADTDQAASDRDLEEGGGDQAVHDATRDLRDRGADQRRENARTRVEAASARDVVAGARDEAAAARDQAADLHDREQAMRDAAGAAGGKTAMGAEALERAAENRERAAADRTTAAEARDRAAADRAQAAHDREQAAHDREQAQADRAELLHQLSIAETDVLTGARTRGPGLADLDHEIDRARRAETLLAVAYIDVVGLKAVNDAQGHAAGDELLQRVVRAIRAHLRSYDLVIRLGGDEFLCVLSGVTIEDARRRFDGVRAVLAAQPSHCELRVGFAVLAAADSAAELIQRADAELPTGRRR